MSRLATPRMAVVVGAFVAIALAAFAPAIIVDNQWSVSNFGTPFAIFSPCAAVGFVIAWRRPRNPIGWLLLAIGSGVLATECGYYTQAAYGVDRGSLPLGWLTALVGQTYSLVTIGGFALVFVLFPDGRAPSRAMRMALVGFGGLGVVSLASGLAYAAAALIDGRVDAGTLSPGGGRLLINQPTTTAWLYTIQAAFVVAAGALLVAGVVVQLVSYRRATGERRQQLKWLMSGEAVCVVALLLLGSRTAGGGDSALAQLWSQIPWIALSAMPISIGIAILKARLYEIDRIVSRTLSYALLTALLAGTFVGLVALTTGLLPFSSSVGVAASTLAAAALFNPLRVRVQHLMDRRFNRARYDAEATVNAFAARLRDAVDIDAVQAELLATVRGAVEPAHASVWVRGGSQ